MSVNITNIRACPVEQSVRSAIQERPRHHSRILFVYDLDLLVDYLAGKPVDRDVHPVTLLTVDNEIILEASRIWFIATQLRDDVDHRVPRACLRYGWDCVPQKLALPGNT